MDAATRQPEARHGTAARLAAFARWSFLFVVAVAAILVIGGTLAFQHLDEEIRQHVEQKFRLHYAPRGLVVRIGSARRAPGKGIELRDIRLIQPDLPPENAEVAYIGEGLVSCSTDMQDLLAGNLHVGHVTVRRLKIRATREPDGTWNARRLFPLPQFSDCPPQGTIEQGVVEIVDSAERGGAVLTLRDIDCQILPEACEAREADGSRPPPAVIRVKGSFTGEQFQRIAVDGTIDPEQGLMSATGTAEGVAISPALRASLPREAADALAPIAALRGILRLDFRLSKKLDGSEPPRFAVSGELSDGQIEDPRLPSPLTEIRANLFCDNAGLKVDRMTAKSGLGLVDLTCRREGFAANSPLVIKAKARRIELDGRLARALPPELRGEWEKLNPSGQIDVDLSLSFDGRRWQPNLKIDCVDVSFAHHLFPYRLSGGLGTIELVENALRVRLKALAAGQLVRIEGDFQNPGPDFVGALNVSLDRPIPIDETLLASLDEKSQAVVRSLRPRGNITCQARFERTRRSGEIEPRLRVEMGLVDCAIRYEKFAYPFERVRGTLVYSDGGWVFKNLEGYNGSAYVTCEGGWASAEQGGLLRLDFVATDVPLEDELHRALNPESQRIWAEMRPRGVVDHLKVGMTYSSLTEDFGLSIRAEKWKKQQNLEGRSISVEPSWFPYRLDHVTGSAEYRDGRVTFTNISGTHGATSVSLSGTTEFSPGGAWRVHFERLTANRLKFDNELLTALPAPMRANVGRLNLSGLISVQGALEFKGNSQTETPPQVAWNTHFDLENAALECGVKIEHLHGGLRLVGSHDGRNLRSRGELQFDSLVHRDIQFIGVSGPLWIDGSQIVLGSRADVPRPGVPPRQITATVYGGKLAGDLRISLAGDAEFDVQATVADADLSVLSQELIRKDRKLAGKGYGSLRLAGNSLGTYTWRGNGTIRLRDADIYEVPVMLALLKVLSIRRPDTTAFNNGDIDFRIQGDRFYFDRLDFKGDAVTLKGSGEMDLDRNVNMQFYTLVGRDEVRLPIITPMLGLASQQLLLIEVAGTVEKPELKKKAFPALNDTLKQLFPEAAEAKTARGPSLVSPGEALERSGLMRR